MLRGDIFIQPYPNRSVIEDVLTRIGNPTDSAFTPFVGQSEIINEQFRGQSRDRFNLEDLISYTLQTKMDLDPKKIMKPQVINGLELQDKENAGYEILEDMEDDEASLKKWISMVIIGYKKNSGSPYNMERERYTRVILDDDDEETEEKYMIAEDKDMDLDAYYKVIDEIPYLLKIMHNRSKIMHAHLFSFTRAYALIMRHKGSNAEIVPRDFSGHQLWRVKDDGRFDRQFVHEQDNKSPDYREALAFIQGYSEHDYAYKACMKLITCLESIGVDIANEDPRDFDNAFIDRLVCNYIPKNDEYVSTYGNIDPELIAALSPDRLFTVQSQASFMDTKLVSTENDIISYIKQDLEIAKVHHPGLFDEWDESRRSLVMKYMQAVKLYNDLKTNPKAKLATFNNGFEFVDGLLYYRKSIAKWSGEFCGRLIGPYDKIYPDVIFSTYGIAIVLPKSYRGIYYVSIEECLERLKTIYGGQYNTGGWYML